MSDLPAAKTAREGANADETAGSAANIITTHGRTLTSLELITLVLIALALITPAPKLCTRRSTLPWKPTCHGETHPGEDTESPDHPPTENLAKLML